MNTDKGAIEQFRKNLPIIRIAAGWTGEDLAKLIGVSRATIIILENPGNVNRMSKVQYLATQAVLQAEIKMNNNLFLEDTLKVLTDDSDKVPEKVKQDIHDKAISVIRKSLRPRGCKGIRDNLIAKVGQIIIDTVNEYKL